MNKLVGIPLPKQSYAYYVIRGVNNNTTIYNKNRYINLKEPSRNINCVYRNDISWYKNTNYFTTVINYKQSNKVFIEEMLVTALPNNLYNIEYYLDKDVYNINNYDFQIKLKILDDKKTYDFIENHVLNMTKTFLL
jgi:hypothetical protein